MIRKRKFKFDIFHLGILRKYEETGDGGYAAFRRHLDDVQKHKVDIQKFHKNLTIVIRELKESLDQVGLQ